MRYSVISFDLDGTLVDTGAEIAAAVNRTLTEFGLPAQPESLIFGFIGAGTRTTVGLVLLGKPPNHRATVALIVFWSKSPVMASVALAGTYQVL